MRDAYYDADFLAMSNLNKIDGFIGQRHVFSDTPSDFFGARY